MMEARGGGAAEDVERRSASQKAHPINNNEFLLQPAVDSRAPLRAGNLSHDTAASSECRAGFVRRCKGE